HLTSQSSLVRRSVIDKISRYTEEATIIVVYGDGGCGKTSAMWHWINEFYSSLVSQRKGIYSTIMSAADVRANCIAHVICDWGNLPEEHSWRNTFSNTALNGIDRLLSASSR